MKVVILNLSGGKERLQEALSRLPTARRGELEKFCKENAVLSAFSEIALRRELSRKMGVPPADLNILREEGGKPYLAGAPICFNLSHSGDRAALAFDAVPVGIDIQKMGEPPRRVAERIFRANGLQEGGRNAFFRLWTACESVLKWRGSGLKELPLLKLLPRGELFGAEIAGEELPCLVRSFEVPAQENSLAKSGTLREGYALSVCGTGETIGLEFLNVRDLLSA